MPTPDTPARRGFLGRPVGVEAHTRHLEIQKTVELRESVDHLTEVMGDVADLAKQGQAELHVVQRATMYGYLPAAGVMSSWTMAPPSSNLFAVERVVLTVPGDTGQTQQSTFTVPTPAAGADWTYTLPTEMEISAINAQLAVGISSPLRYPALLISQGTTFVYQVGAPLGASADTTAYYSWGQNLSSASYSNYSISPLPNLVLSAGTRVQTSTTNLAGGDQWSQIFITGQVPNDTASVQLGNPATGGLLLVPDTVGTSVWDLGEWIYNPQTDGPPVLTAGATAGNYMVAFVGRQLSTRALLR